MEVWRALVDLAAQHRQFPDAPWAMPGDAVGRVESVAARFAPTSLVDLHADLFGHHPRLPGIDPRDYVAYDEALRGARRDAVRDILDSGGFAELLRFGATVVLPAAVGWAAAEVGADDLADELLPLLGAGGSDGEVARGYAGARIEADGLDWVVQQLQRWPDGESVPQQAGLLLAVPRPTAALITVVDGLHADVRASFWERMVPMRAHPEAQPLVVRHLIDQGRAWAALGVLTMMLPGSATTDPALDADLVESALLSAATGSSVDAHHAASLSWEVGELLDYLEHSGSDLQTRARLEFLFTNLLQHTRPARALDEALRTDPALFAELISYVYWAEDEPRDQEVPPERKAVAEVGFAVIRSWHTPPGVRPDGTVDADALHAWVTEARRLLAASGRTIPGDVSIGEVLAYVPPDSDGLWPAKPVRDLIEDLRSEHFETGLRTGKFNSRGLITWSPTGGGVQERGLAATVSSMGRACRRRLAPDRSSPAPARRPIRRVGATGGRSIRGLRGPRPLIRWLGRVRCRRTSSQHRQMREWATLLPHPKRVLPTSFAWRRSICYLDANEILSMAQDGCLWLHACSISVIECFSLPYVACRRPMMAPHLAPWRCELPLARKSASAAEQSAAHVRRQRSMPGTKSPCVVEEPWHLARVPAVVAPWSSCISVAATAS